MILDALGTFSEAQTFSAISASTVQSTNWMDLGAYTDILGVTTGRDIGSGQPLYIQFQVTSSFSAADNGNTFRAVAFTDLVDPPNSGNPTAAYMPSSTTFTNNVLGTPVGFQTLLIAGASFTMPLMSTSGGCVLPGNGLAVRDLGHRFLRVAYQFTGPGVMSGAISATLTTTPSAAGRTNPTSKHVGGIYPASVDIGLS